MRFILASTVGQDFYRPVRYAALGLSADYEILDFR